MTNKKPVPPEVERPKIVFDDLEPKKFWDVWLLLRLLLRLSIVLNIVLILYIVQSVPNA